MADGRTLNCVLLQASKRKPGRPRKVQSAASLKSALLSDAGSKLTEGPNESADDFKLNFSRMETQKRKRGRPRKLQSASTTLNGPVKAESSITEASHHLKPFEKLRDNSQTEDIKRHTSSWANRSCVNISSTVPGQIRPNGQLGGAMAGRIRTLGLLIKSPNDWKPSQRRKSKTLPAKTQLTLPEATVLKDNGKSPTTKAHGNSAETVRQFRRRSNAKVTTENGQADDIVTGQPSPTRKARERKSKAPKAKTFRASTKTVRKRRRRSSAHADGDDEQSSGGILIGRRRRQTWCCDECNLMLISKLGFQMHRCRRRPGTGGSGTRGAMVGASHERRFECDRCARTFDFKPSLVRHCRIVHDGLRSYWCQQCGTSFSQELSYRRHRIYQHQEGQRETVHCDLCMQSFCRKDALREHIFHKHTTGSALKLPFPCGICRRGFLHLYRVRRHMLVSHARVKRVFACGETGCGGGDDPATSFTSKHRLLLHCHRAHQRTPGSRTTHTGAMREMMEQDEHTPSARTETAELRWAPVDVKRDMKET